MNYTSDKINYYPSVESLVGLNKKELEKATDIQTLKTQYPKVHKDLTPIVMWTDETYKRHV